MKCQINASRTETEICAQKSRENQRDEQESKSCDMDPKPHAVCVPYPEQGHIKPMMTMAKLLHLRGFHVTFVHSTANYNQILAAAGTDSLRGCDDFRFEAIAEEPCSDTVHFRHKFRNPLRDLVFKRLNHAAAGSPVPPVTVIVSDSFTMFSHDVADELGVPKVVYTSVGACAMMAYVYLEHLVQRGLVPLKSEDDLTNGYLDTVIDWVPGMNNMRLRDFPTFIRTTNLDTSGIIFVMDEIKQSFQASAIIINTFDEFEGPVLDALSKILPPLYAVGPLHLLSRKMPNPKLESSGSSLWQEDSQCLKWLEGRAPGSVLYVNFGSTTIVSSQQLVEFAWGLANSGRDFLWVIRENLVKGETAVLPEEFMTETKGRSLLANWCMQEQVLMHPAIGGFLTHCGWNSMLESITSGVPMICWPFFADHHPYCRQACTEWGIGLEIGDVKRENVEATVRELMEGDKGKEMRSKTAKLKGSAEKAVEPEGSSFRALDKVIKEVLLRENYKNSLTFPKPGHAPGLERAPAGPVRAPPVTVPSDGH